MEYWKGKKVILTGGGGFLGSHVHDLLNARSADCFIPRSASFDLTEQSEVRRLFREHEAELVIHCAVTGGGIGFMAKNPGTAFYDNLMMNTLLMEEARKSGVKKFVGIGTVCSYPKHTPVPFSEAALWNGYPEETNAPYGLSKKMLLTQSQAYRQQYGFNAIHLLLANLYGPRDNFDPENSHVIPALIRKCCTAVYDGRTSIEVWGTGSASREFLYVEDAAEAVLMAAEQYDSSEPVNIGSGEEITIRELVDRIAYLCGFHGTILWDEKLPDGQPRRKLDTSKAYREFGFSARTGLDDGLEATIRWFREKSLEV